MISTISPSRGEQLVVVEDAEALSQDHGLLESAVQ
jgi:hypothetical protein